MAAARRPMKTTTSVSLSIHFDAVLISKFSNIAARVEVPCKSLAALKILHLGCFKAFQRFWVSPAPRICLLREMLWMSYNCRLHSPRLSRQIMQGHLFGLGGAQGSLYFRSDMRSSLHFMMASGPRSIFQLVRSSVPLRR